MNYLRNLAQRAAAQPVTPVSASGLLQTRQAPVAPVLRTPPASSAAPAPLMLPPAEPDSASLSLEINLEVPAAPARSASASALRDVSASPSLPLAASQPSAPPAMERPPAVITPRSPAFSPDRGESGLANLPAPNLDVTGHSPGAPGLRPVPPLPVGSVTDSSSAPNNTLLPVPRPAAMPAVPRAEHLMPRPAPPEGRVSDLPRRIPLTAPVVPSGRHRSSDGYSLAASEQTPSIQPAAARPDLSSQSTPWLRPRSAQSVIRDDAHYGDPDLVVPTGEVGARPQTQVVPRIVPGNTSGAPPQPGPAQPVAFATPRPPAESTSSPASTPRPLISHTIDVHIGSIELRIHQPPPAPPAPPAAPGLPVSSNLEAYAARRTYHLGGEDL